MHKNDFEKKDPMYSYVTAITEISKKYQLCQPALLACFPGYAAYLFHNIIILLSSGIFVVRTVDKIVDTSV